LYGFDIDEQKINKLKIFIQMLNYLTTTNKLNEKYDFIVGNPPYNGDESHFVRENR